MDSNPVSSFKLYRNKVGNYNNKLLTRLIRDSNQCTINTDCQRDVHLCCCKPLRSRGHLSRRHALASLDPFCEAGPTILLLRTRNRQPRHVKQLARGHASKQWAYSSNPDGLGGNSSHFLFTYLFFAWFIIQHVNLLLPRHPQGDWGCCL